MNAVGNMLGFIIGIFATKIWIKILEHISTTTLKININ
jgi:hypothetical protein